MMETEGQIRREVRLLLHNLNRKRLLFPRSVSTGDGEGEVDGDHHRYSDNLLFIILTYPIILF